MSIETPANPVAPKRNPMRARTKKIKAARNIHNLPLCVF